MKYWTHILIAAVAATPGLSFSQSPVLAEAWQDAGFVERFKGSFLPLTEQEPKITEKESELLGQLSQLLAANQNDAGLQLLADHVRKAPIADEVSAALNYTLANLYLQTGKYSQAVVQYETAIKKFDNFRRAFKNLGLAYIQNRQFGNAIKALVKSIEMGDASGDTFGLLAYAYLNEGNPSAALEGYRQASLMNPNNREWRIGKAEALMRTQRYEEAIAEFKELIEELPTRSAFYTSIANAYLSVQKPDMAAHYLEMLRRKGEAKATALGLLGDIYVNDSLPRLALAAYQDAVNTGDFSTSKSIRSLKALLARGNFPEAEAFLVTVKASVAAKFSEKESREVLNLQAQRALAKGQDEEAAKLLEQVLEQDPLNGNALMLLGEYNLSKGDVESAVFYYQRAESITDFQRNAQLQLARIHVQQKEYKEAIRYLEAALSLEYSANVQDFLDAVKAAYSRSI